MAGTLSTQVQSHVLKILAHSTIPMSAIDLTEKLKDNNVIYHPRHVQRKLKEMLNAGTVELVGKRGRTELFSLPNQTLEPWEATSIESNPHRPTIKLNGHYYSPESLTKSLVNAHWTILNDTANEELRAELTLLVMGTAAYGTLQAHSILPVQHVRRPLEEFNSKLKLLSSMIETLLGNDLIKTGQSGNSLSNQTRDSLLAELEPWMTKVGINVRSNVQK